MPGEPIQLQEIVRRSLTEIHILKPKTAKLDHLIIDVVVKLPLGLCHISRLTYSSSGLYDVPLTRQFGVDVHTSYHSSGEMHEKLTRGKLVVYPGKRVLGKAKPHTKVREVLLWQKKGQPWYTLKGVERVTLHQKGVQGFTNITAMAAGYPIYRSTGADYAFKIDARSVPSEMVDIDIGYFLVEPGNKQALEAEISEIKDSWHNPHESVTVEKAELFTNLSPWLAIVLFSKKDEGSESFLSGEPG